MTKAQQSISVNSFTTDFIHKSYRLWRGAALQ